MTEFDLIGMIRNFNQEIPAGLEKGIGDDCAVFSLSTGENFVCTTDLLVEGKHFRRSWISPEFLGRKACRVNVSDLAAMGATPYACLLAVVLPGELTGAYFRRFVEAFLHDCRRFGMPVVGGDLSAGDQIVVNVCAWGKASPGSAVCRSGAHVGDGIYLVGCPGLARWGLEWLRRENPPAFDQIGELDELAHRVPDPTDFSGLAAFLEPEIYVQVGCWLAERGLANAMIDVSDGLASDLLHILEESGCSAELQLEEIPLIADLEGQRELAYDFALNGGEDYNLLFTASADQENRWQSEYPDLFPRPRACGRIIAGRGDLFLLKDGGRILYEPGGFDHFS